MVLDKTVGGEGGSDKHELRAPPVYIWVSGRMTHPLTNPPIPGAPCPGMFYNLRAASGRFVLVVYKPNRCWLRVEHGFTYLYLDRFWHPTHLRRPPRSGHPSTQRTPGIVQRFSEDGPDVPLIGTCKSWVCATLSCPRHTFKTSR